MRAQSMTPYGMALLDYFNGDKEARVTMHRDDGAHYELPVSIFFQEEPQFSTIEQKALALCRGKILDVGAGTGKHSLVLLKKGFTVDSVDISPEAVEIMTKRGIKHARCSNIFDFREGRYDTILMLLHGVGMVETLDGFRRFLNHAENLLNPKGIILFDTLDVRVTEDPGNLAYQEKNKKQNRYIGEIHLQFEYKGEMGSPHSWLHLDPDTLEDEVSKQGWQKEIIHREPWGDYLAKLLKQ